MDDYLPDILEALLGYDPFVKTAAVKEKFKPFIHQQDSIQRFIDNDGQIIMAHGTGSGKTFSSIFAFEAGRQAGIAKKALVVVPAGLRTNYAEKGIKKATDDTYQVFGSKSEVAEGTHVDTKSLNKDATYSIVSYNMFRKDPTAYMEATGADTLIGDEIHKAKSPHSTTYKALMTARGMARNFIGLTGSVVSNKPADIVTLLNLAAGWPVAGTQTQFDRRYVQVIGSRTGFLGGKKDVKRIIRPEEIQARFGKIVHFVGHDDLDPAMFPKKNVSEILVEMSPEQRELYDFALGELPFWVRKRIRSGLPVGKEEAQHIFGKIIQARQAANSIHTMKATPLHLAAERTPKIRRVLDDAKNHLKTTPDGQVVMYSNLVTGGIDVLAAGLRKRKVSFGVFVGKGREIAGMQVDEESRQKDVESYLSGDIKVLLVSGAGAEGLDLKNTTMVQMVDGHFNPEVIQQAEARGRRAGGLAHRPPERRFVAVKRYKSVMPKPGFWESLFKDKEYTTDQWIYGVAGEKGRLTQQFRQALKGEKVDRPQVPRGFKPKKYKRRWRVFAQGKPEWRYQY